MNKIAVITPLEAAQMGLLSYFTGKRCGNGHFSERYVKNGQCIECNRSRSRQRKRIDIAERRGELSYSLPHIERFDDLKLTHGDCFEKTID